MPDSVAVGDGYQRTGAPGWLGPKRVFVLLRSMTLTALLSLKPMLGLATPGWATIRSDNLSRSCVRGVPADSRFRGEPDTTRPGGLGCE